MDRNRFKLAEVEHKCPLCRKMYRGYGHNGIPVWPGKVCDKCHQRYVIPSRLAWIRTEQEDKD